MAQQYAAVVKSVAGASESAPRMTVFTPPCAPPSPSPSGPVSINSSRHQAHQTQVHHWPCTAEDIGDLYFSLDLLYVEGYDDEADESGSLEDLGASSASSPLGTECASSARSACSSVTELESEQPPPRTARATNADRACAPPLFIQPARDVDDRRLSWPLLVGNDSASCSVDNTQFTTMASYDRFDAMFEDEPERWQSLVSSLRRSLSLRTTRRLSPSRTRRPVSFMHIDDRAGGHSVYKQRQLHDPLVEVPAPSGPSRNSASSHVPRSPLPTPAPAAPIPHGAREATHTPLSIYGHPGHLVGPTPMRWTSSTALEGHRQPPSGPCSPQLTEIMSVASRSTRSPLPPSSLSEHLHSSRTNTWRHANWPVRDAPCSPSSSSSASIPISRQRRLSAELLDFRISPSPTSTLYSTPSICPLDNSKADLSPTLVPTTTVISTSPLTTCTGSLTGDPIISGYSLPPPVEPSSDTTHTRPLTFDPLGHAGNQEDAQPCPVLSHSSSTTPRGSLPRVPTPRPDGDRINSPTTSALGSNTPGDRLVPPSSSSTARPPSPFATSNTSAKMMHGGFSDALFYAEFDKPRFARKPKPPKAPRAASTGMSDSRSLKSFKKTEKPGQGSFLGGFLNNSANSMSSSRASDERHCDVDEYTPPLPMYSPPSPLPIQQPLPPRQPLPPPLPPLPHSASLRIDPLSPVDSFSQHDPFAASKRTSRYSQFTTSSASSDSSPHSPQRINSPQWAVEKRPSVATVLEEESYDDQYSSRDNLSFTNRPNGLLLSTSPPPGRRPSVPAVTESPRAQRPSTVSSTNSQKARKGNHPFAAHGAPSPSLGGERAEFLGAPSSPPVIMESRSAPSLFESYKIASVPTHNVALVSPEDESPDPECPVCCESLNFTYRLPGEKPHVVPECGHGLHEECFVACYGRQPSSHAGQVGVCGVCRNPMRVVSGGVERGGGKNKLAAMMGGDDGSGNGAYGANGSFVDSTSNDDPLEPFFTSAAAALRTPPSDNGIKVVIPFISVTSEHPFVRRERGGKGFIVMVSVQVPPAEDRTMYQARSRKDSISADQATLPPSPVSANSFRESVALPPPTQLVPASVYASAHAELRRRLIDYRAASLETLGPLHLCEVLAVGKANVVRDFHVYLFRDALVCISEERKQGLRSIFNGKHGDTPKGRTLKLRGRVFLKHVHAVVDTSNKTDVQLALTLETEEEGTFMFVLGFKDHSTLEIWRTTIRRLMDDAQPAGAGKLSKLTGGGTNMLQARSAMASDTSNAGSSVTPTYSEISTPTHNCDPGCPGCLAYHIPMAPHHTPIDLFIIVSTPAPASGMPSSALPLKSRLLRTSIQFVLACMGPRDRIALISAEHAKEGATNGVVRRTPLLNATRHDSRARLEAFVDRIGLGRIPGDEFEVYEDNHKVDTAINVALDVILGRKAKNPITGVVVISDTSDTISREQMELPAARLEAAKVPVHTFGYGKAHNPSPLWLISQNTQGSYTFVKEWYHLRDALGGVVGGLMSIALTHMKLRLTVQDNDVRINVIKGVHPGQAVIASGGKEVYVELNELRHTEKREILVEFQFEDDATADGNRISNDPSIDDISGRLAPQRSLTMKQLNGRRPSVHNGAMNLNGVNGEVYEGVSEDAHLDEVAVVEVDCSFHDPLIGRSAARLTQPVLLTLPVMPLSVALPSQGDSAILCRRMECLGSDMMHRAVVTASRRNFTSAINMLRETKRIIEQFSDGLRSSLPPPSAAPSRRVVSAIHAVERMTSTIQDVDTFLDGLENYKELYEKDHRNYAVQQVAVLRLQRSWTVRSPTELHYATPDVQALISASSNYTAPPRPDVLRN